MRHLTDKFAESIVSGFSRYVSSSHGSSDNCWMDGQSLWPQEMWKSVLWYELEIVHIYQTGKVSTVVSLQMCLWNWHCLRNTPPVIAYPELAMHQQEGMTATWSLLCIQVRETHIFWMISTYLQVGYCWKRVQSYSAQYLPAFWYTKKVKWT